MKKLALLAPLALATACHPALVHDSTTKTVLEDKPHYSCTSMAEGKLAVFPLRNKTKDQLDLAGMDDILIADLTQSKCFQPLERDKDKMDVLFAEMDHCAPDSPDRKRFDCSSFAAAGKQLGASHYVFADIVLAAPNVAAAELQAQFPKIGNIEHNEVYSAIVMSVRAVDVSTGEVAGSSVVFALVPSAKSGMEVGVHGASLKAIAESHTPMGSAVMDMLAKSVEDIHNSWHATSGKTAGETPATPAAATPAPAAPAGAGNGSSAN